jgi:hypothetical protein
MATCAVLLQSVIGSSNFYDLLWAAVFGFATLNILGLVARRFEPGRSSMTFGEMLAIGTPAVYPDARRELLFMFHVPRSG